MSKMKNIYTTDFESFARKAFRILKPGERLGDDPYLGYLCYVAEQIAKGLSPWTVINLPPGHLKTFLFSIAMVAWILMKNPTKSIMVVTNAQDLAEEITRSIRTILRSEWFRSLCNTRIDKERTSVGDFRTTD